MKKLFLVITLLCASLMTSAFASNDFTPFTTLEQAQQYCPAANALTFTPNNPEIPNSGGTITGNNRVAFESFPAKKSYHPKNMDASGLITDADFRSADGLYGYISNNVVTCLYSYTTFADVQALLALRSK